jgi:SHS family lactate transporter-like MFS transporter
MGCVFAYTIIVTLLGPERLGRDFDVAHDGDVREVVQERHGGDASHLEKGTTTHAQV